MKAELLTRIKHITSDDSFAEIVIWMVPTKIAGSNHLFKYRMVFVKNNECILRYDNEHGKGDHKHLGDAEFPVNFVSLSQLIHDSWKDVDAYKEGSI